MENGGQSFFEAINNICINIPRIMLKYNVPGLAISIIHDGKISLSRGFGYANKESKELVDINTIFQVGSLSKSITAWGIIKLAQDKILDLDEPVEKYLTRWRLPYSKYDHNMITSRKILSHTAGLSVRSYLGYNGHNNHSIEDSLSGRLNSKYELKVISEPGKFIYSGGGYTLLQLVIEEVTGQTFPSYIKNTILMPLDMHYSTFDPIDYKKGQFNTKPYGAYGYKLPIYDYVEKAAAGFYTTISDMTKFALAHVSDTNTVLSKKFMNEMFTRIKREIGAGLGYTIKTVENNKLIMARGCNRGWMCSFDSIPKRKESIVIMTNSLNGSNAINDILYQWYGMILKKNINLGTIYTKKRSQLQTSILDKMVLFNYGKLFH